LAISRDGARVYAPASRRPVGKIARYSQHLQLSFASLTGRGLYNDRRLVLKRRNVLKVVFAVVMEKSKQSQSHELLLEFPRSI
jgi:hypothetical protein